MLGAVGENWADNTDLQAFTILYLMVMFLLVLNFVLAIIVEAYMGVRKANEECVIEMDFFSDVLVTAYAHVLSVIHDWPNNQTLGLYLQGMNAKFNVTFWDLYLSGLFPSQKSMESFIQFYSAFEYCEPIKFNSFGKLDTSEQAEDREWMTKFMVALMDRRPLKLKELPKAEGAKAKKRRASGVFGSSASDFNSLLSASNGPKVQIARLPSSPGREEPSLRQEASIESPNTEAHN